MLYSLMDLPRDGCMETTSLGHSDYVGFDLDWTKFSSLQHEVLRDKRAIVGWDMVLSVGKETDRADKYPLSLPTFVKSLEVVSPTGNDPLHIERYHLDWKGNLLPFMIRYRDRSNPAGDSVVNKPNLSSFHRCEIKDPRLTAIEYVANERDDCHELSCIAGAAENRQPYAAHTFSAGDVQNDLRLITNHFKNFSDPLGIVERSRMPVPILRSAVVDIADPGVPRKDALAFNFASGAIPTSVLTQRSSPRKIDVNTSQPPPLRVENGVTEINPRWARDIANHLSLVVATDVDVRYILQHRGIWTVELHSEDALHNRYADLLGSRDHTVRDRYHLRQIAEEILLHYVTHNKGNGALLEKVCSSNMVRIVKTFNDEALVEISVDGLTVHGAYLDLVALSLCSMGISAP